MRLFDELKRRNVLRAGAFYAAATWALAQGIAQLGPFFGAQEWSVRWFVIACIVGFPFWLAFAWFYEFTPSGLKRESDIAPGESVAHSTGRKLDFWIIGILAVAVVLLITNQFVLHRDVNSAANANDAKAIAAELAKAPDQSVAVLPLANQSGKPEQQYFLDGLSEELISDLTQINGLKVIGKYSSFKFRDSKDSPAQIGATLGVAHLIEGSVFQEGVSIRVTVSMIRAKDGSSVWSHSYEEQLKDVFAIQTKIGRAVASSLQVKLLGQTLGIDNKPPSGSVEAYQLMLQGRALIRRATEVGCRQGIALLQQALLIDPDYAYALGSMSIAWINLGANYLTGDARQNAWQQARAAADKAQALAPDAATTHLIRGDLLAHVDNDPVRALAEYHRAHALAPNDGSATNFLALGSINLGQLPQAADLYRKAIATDPLRSDFYFNLAVALLAQGQLDPAEQATRKVLALQPDFPQVHSVLAQIDILRGEAAAAVRGASQETDPVFGPWIRALAQQIDPDIQRADAALRAYIDKYGKDQPYLTADLHALRKQPDAVFDWLQRAWTQQDPFLINNLLSDPFALAYRDDARFAALCKQLGLPLPGGVLATAADAGPLGPSPSKEAAAATP